MAPTDTLALADVMHFEMDGLMHHKQLVLPVLTYLFHRLEARFDGRPTLLILDEAWVFLDDPLFAARIREWLKTLERRTSPSSSRRNRSPTSSARRLRRPSWKAARRASFCPTIGRSNRRWRTSTSASASMRRQIEILARAIPKRDYYAQTARGNRLFALGLGPVALAFAAVSSSNEQRLIDQVLEAPMPNGFGAAFLRAKGLAWAAEVIETVPVSDAPPAAVSPPILATPTVPPLPKPPPLPKRIIPPTHPLLNSTAVNAVLPPIPPDPATIALRLTPFRTNAAQPKRTHP